MSDKPQYRRLDGEEVFDSPKWQLAAEIGRSQPPFDKFFDAYQRTMDGKPKPGDRFFILRQLIEVFSANGAYVLCQLGRDDDSAFWEWGISLFHREPPALKALRGDASADAQKFSRMKKDRRDWAIYNRVLAMIEDNASLPDAYRAIANTKPDAEMLGEESIKAIWRDKSAEVRRNGERLVPQPLLGATALPPGKKPKLGRRKKQV